MPTDAAHQRGWQTFEIVFGLPFLAALVLQWFAPLSIPRGPILTLIMLAGGVALIIVGTVIVVLARRELAQLNQPTNPGHPTSQVVTIGIFSISRNPLYLGGVCILVGIALAFNLGWGFVLLLPALIACHYLLIAPEERYLTAKFGDDYLSYVATVRRWLGRRHRDRSPTTG